MIWLVEAHIKPTYVLMPFSFAVSSVSSLYGTVSTEGGNAPERSSRHPFHLGHVEVLQGGAGGGKGKEVKMFILMIGGLACTSI